MPSDKAKKWIDRANEMLGKGRVKLQVIGAGDWISVRGTLPPKPDSNKTYPHQQRVSLKMQAVDWQTVLEAIRLAKQLDLDLNRGVFDWRKFEGFEEPIQAPVVISDWVKKLEEQWWQVNSNKDTWRTKYQYPLRSLLEDYAQQELTVELLKNWISSKSKKDSDARKRFCFVARRLAELAGLPTHELRLYKGNYSHSSVNPRDLPSDEEIIRVGLGIKDPGWRFIYGMLATYGLRPHEVFKFDSLSGGLIRVREDTKTGARSVPPLPENWIDLFKLDEVIYPPLLKINVDATNSELGEKISKKFKTTVGWNAYNLRHAYARRWFEKGLSSDIAAKFMGHSPVVHSQVYRAWIDELTYLEIAKSLT